MEIITTIHFHIAHMFSLWTFIYGKHWHIGKKDSNNKQKSYDFHIHFLPIKGRWLSTELLNLYGVKVLAGVFNREPLYDVKFFFIKFIKNKFIN